MTRDDGYIRIYYRFRDEFADVWADDRLLATWVRLLMLADPTWAGPGCTADLPRSAAARAVSRLAERDLIELLDGDRFRLRGLDKERERRSAPGRPGAAKRWSSKSSSSPDAMAMRTDMRSQCERIDIAMPDETRRDETRRDTPNAREDAPSEGDDDAADTYWRLTGKYPTGRSKEWLAQMVAEFGDPAVSRALAAEALRDRTVSTLLGRTQDRLRRDVDKAQEADRQRKAQELRQADRDRARADLDEPWRKEFIAAVYPEPEPAA